MPKALLFCAARLEEGTWSASLFPTGFSKDITGSPGEWANRSATVLKMGRHTLYRHIEKAAHETIHLLLTGDHVPALESIDFVTTRTHRRLDLRGDSPAIPVDRTVMVLRDGFNALDEHLFLSLLRDELKYYALGGCRLAEVQDTGGSQIVQLRLPRYLNVGESYTFSASVCLPDYGRLESVFRLVPVTSMHAVRTELHFEACLPSLIERIDRVWPYQLMSLTASGYPVDVMGKRAAVSFRGMQPDWDYGVRWT